MQRRRLLVSAALLGASTLAGCNVTSSETPPPRPDAPDGIADWSFTAPVEIVDVERESPPEVTCEPAAARVRIAGVAPSGNGCSSLYPDRVALDGGILSLVVAAWQPSGSCPDVARFPGYEATFSFAEGLPDRVRVVEPADLTGDETRTTTSEC